MTDTVAEVSTTMSVTKLNINPQLSLQIKRDTNRGLEMFRLAAVPGTYMNVCYPGWIISSILFWSLYVKTIIHTL